MKQYTIIIGILSILYACKEEPVGQIPVDTIPPGEVTNIKVTNIPGGARFTYTLPDDDDLLYVKAIYQLQEGGETFDTRASLYTDTLTIEGFGDTLEREVDLIAVDRSNNESNPVTVTIHPETPPVFTIFDSLDMAEEFGGIKYNWTNETASNICLHILRKDNKTGDYETLDDLYTKRVKGESSVLGLKSKETDFGIYITDRWGNNSDTLKKTLTPIFEMQIPYNDVKPYNMPGDTPSEHGWLVDYLFNDIIYDGAGAGYHTEVFSGPWPHRVTFKVMTGKIKCSRIKIYHRDGYFYRHGNVKKFELWASNDPNPDGSDDGWTFLGEYESYKPSGLPGTDYTNEDLEYIAAGESFKVPAEFESFEYFRTKFTESWSGSKFVHIMEIQLFGKPDGYEPDDEEEEEEEDDYYY